MSGQAEDEVIVRATPNGSRHSVKQRASGAGPFQFGAAVIHYGRGISETGGMVDFNKLSKGDKIVAGAGLLLIIDLLFLPWHHIRIAGIVSVNRTGVQSPNSFYGVLALLLALVMVAQVVVSKLTTAKLPDIPVPWAQVHLIAGIAVFALLLLKLRGGDQLPGIRRLPGIDLRRRPGIRWLHHQPGSPPPGERLGLITPGTHVDRPGTGFARVGREPYRRSAAPSPVDSLPRSPGLGATPAGVASQFVPCNWCQVPTDRSQRSPTQKRPTEPGPRAPSDPRV